MRLIEIIIISVGLLVGYWLVSAMLSLFAPKAADGANRVPPSSQPGEDEQRKSEDQSWSSEPDNKGNAARPWWDVLGVAATASEAEVRTAYKRLIAMCHPDRVSHMSFDLRRLAEEHAKEINTAYVQALKESSR